MANLTWSSGDTILLYFLLYGLSEAAQDVITHTLDWVAYSTNIYFSQFLGVEVQVWGASMVGF